MTRMLSLALALGAVLASGSPVLAIRPRMPPRPPVPPPAFRDLTSLTESTCAALGKMVTHPGVAKHLRALQRKGGQLRSITPLPRTSPIEQTVVFTVLSVSSPLDPNPPAPWSASFKVKLFLPQDAGWQIGEVSTIEVIGLPSDR